MRIQFFEYFRSEYKSLRTILIFTITSAVMVLSIPFFIQNFIQHLTLLVFQQSTTFLILIIAIFLVGITVVRVLQLTLSEYLQRRLFLRAMEDAKSYYQKQKEKGNSVSRRKWNYVFESVSLQKSVVPLFIEGFTFFLQAVIVLLLVSAYHPFFLFYSLILVVALYFVIFVMGKKTLEFAHKESDLKHSVIEKIQLNPEDSNIPQEMIDYYTIRDRRFIYYRRQSVGLFVIKILASILLIIAGTILVLGSRMTIGQLIASELIVTNLLISLFKFSYVLDYFYDSVVSVRKLSTYTDQDLK